MAVLNTTRIIIENGVTTKVSNLANRKELHGKPRNMSHKGNKK